MYDLLIKLIIAAALLDLGITISRSGDCSSRECRGRIDRAVRQVLRIEWRPISAEIRN
jgi:hypothetical protein